MEPMDRETLDRCEAYAEALYARETETQGWIREELEARGLPRIQVSPLEGRLLAVLARSVGARRLLEVGTLGGTSALWLLSLLPEGARLVTLERNPEHARLAREAFRRAGEDGRTELREGDARDALAALREGPPFDLVFVDADKEGYPAYLEAATELLAPGGILLADNTFWEGRVTEEEGGDAATRALRAFNRTLADDPRFEAVIVPVRDGLTVARFRG